MHLKAFFALLPLSLMLLLGACAQQVGDIDRTQPNLIPKSTFDGEWYYQRTIVDVPSGNGFTFVGSADFSGLDVVRFDLQEKVLLIRRNIELITGADDLLTAGEGYEGEVIAAFPVQHVDVIRQYNAQTGEETNVILENQSDRPWYDRDFVRVSWESDLVHDMRFDFNRVMLEPMAFYPQDGSNGNPDDAPHFEEDGSYFDLTVRLFARASLIHIPGYGDFPTCYLFGSEFDECGAGEYSVRHSFMRRAPEERQYVPAAYKGPVTNLFGFFTADRMHYDPQEGIRDQGRSRYLTRHNLWENWVDASTCRQAPPAGQAFPQGFVRTATGEICKEIPVPNRTLRPIVYHVNTDFPDDLKPIVEEVADQWDSIFRDVVEAQGYTLAPGERTFYVCPNNPVEEGDPEVCGAPGTRPRLGDIRYSFMAYIPKYMQYGLLGLGPSNNDPITGEIFSGMAYVYHHNNLAAYSTARMIQLLQEPAGSPALREFIDGLDLSEWAEQVRGNVQAPSRTFELADASHMVHSIANGWMTQYWDGERRSLTPADVEHLLEVGFARWAEPYLRDMRTRGILNGETRSANGRLQQLSGTYIEELLLNNEVMAMGGQMPGQRLSLDTNNDGVPDAVARASVLRGGFAQGAMARDQLRQELAETQNMYLPEMADDALMGLARDFKLEGLSLDEIIERVRTSIYTAVFAHEVGHSLGLMHNFGGSDDAINYFDEYWAIRDDGFVGPRTVDPISDDEINASIYNYGYSSIMDYSGRYTVDGAGVGKYDRAAMLFGYADMVEVFRDSGSVPTSDFAAWFSGNADVITGGGSLGIRTIHYTSFFHRMGERLWSQDNRMLVPLSAFEEGKYDSVTVDGSTFNRVPYVYCSHSSSDLSDHCLTRDSGADSMERMKNIIDDLNTWYILRNFPRGVIGANTFNYVDRYYWRVYDRMKNWNNLYGLYAALLAQFFTPAQLEGFLNDPQEGFGAKTWAVQNAFNYLVQTLFMPDIGTYNHPAPQADGSILGTSATTLFATINLDVTNARYYSTNWSFGGRDGRDCGYMWYECLHHIGFYLDKIMAIEALTDSSTNFVARSTPEDIREWEVSFYNTFPDQIAAISQAIMGQNFENVAPSYEGGQLVFPNYTGPLDTPQATPIDPYATFTIQLYWQVLGQARFPNNYDRSFVQESRIFELGTGTAPTLDPTRLASFTNSKTGLSYGALRYVDRDTAGYGMIRRARCLDAIANWDGDTEAATQNPFEECDAFADLAVEDRRANLLPSAQTAAFELDRYIDLFEIMADMSFLMNYGDPYNP